MLPPASSIHAFCLSHVPAFLWNMGWVLVAYHSIEFEATELCLFTTLVRLMRMRLDKGMSACDSSKIHCFYAALQSVVPDIG